jgi:hypothetical protein
MGRPTNSTMPPKRDASPPLVRSASTTADRQPSELLFVSCLTGLVLAAVAGPVPAALPMLVRLGIPLAGSICRLGLLGAGGLLAIASIPGTCRRDAGGWLLGELAARAAAPGGSAAPLV